MTIEQRVNEYAKANKVNRAKLLEFVQSLLAEVPKEVVKVGGRKADESTLELRQRVRELQTKGWKQEGFTALQLAVELNTSPVYATNALKWLAENEQTVYIAGTAAKPAGQRGKAPSLWKWKD